MRRLIRASSLFRVTRNEPEPTNPALPFSPSLCTTYLYQHCLPFTGIPPAALQPRPLRCRLPQQAGSVRQRQPWGPPVTFKNTL